MTESTRLERIVLELLPHFVKVAFNASSTVPGKDFKTELWEPMVNGMVTVAGMIDRRIQKERAEIVSEQSK